MKMFFWHSSRFPLFSHYVSTLFANTESYFNFFSRTPPAYFYFWPPPQHFFCIPPPSGSHGIALIPSMSKIHFKVILVLSTRRYWLFFKMLTSGYCKDTDTCAYLPSLKYQRLYMQLRVELRFTNLLSLSLDYNQAAHGVLAISTPP